MSRAGESFDHDQEVGLLQAIYLGGGDYLGTILKHDDRSFEAFNINRVSLGVSTDAEDATNALYGCWEARSNGGASTVGEKPDLEPEPAQEGNGQLTHDKAMASTFLTGLDPTATRFTFQTFDDNKDRKSKKLARVLHGTLDEVWPKILALNTSAIGAGIFVTTSETNFLGRCTKNIVRPRALFYDADGDEQVSHATTAIEAHDAIPSMTVISGGGRHGYYICDDIPLDRFSALQKSLALKLGTDGNVHDLPRVMRLPGTLHLKDPTTPRLVKLLQADRAVKIWKLSDLMDKLGLSTPDRTNGKGDGAQQPPRLKVSPAFAHIDASRNVAEGIVLEEVPPLPFAPIKEGCAWLREAHDTGGKEFDEPQWNLTTLVAPFLIDGNELAHQFGSQHPGYTFESTEKKFEEKQRAHETKGIGWPLCKTISENGGKPHCSKCPHFAKGKSPLNIGFDAARDESDSEELRQLGGTRPPELRLPEDFCLNEDGIVCAFIPSKIVKGKVQKGGLLPLTNNRISAPSLQFQNGRFGIGFTASTDRGGMTEVLLTSTQCYKEHGLLKQLAEKAVMYTPGKAAGELIEKFFVDWFNKLRCEDVAIRDHGTLGWRYKDGEIVGFVYGNTLYHEDGSEMSIVAASDNEFRSHYMPTGDRETWLAAAKLLTDRKRPELDTIISIGFAAPLMAFAGTLYGAILSIWGDPGTSKSTAQQVAAAVWGHPKQTRESLNSTPKSVQRRLGLCRNLAAYWDDIQDERHQDALFNTMFVATQGAEGGRLNQDASMKERLEWQTLLAACSNASFIEYLTKKQKSTTAGMRRLFEFKYDKKDNEPGMVNLVDAMQAFAALEHNFGRIGAEYAKILATEHKDLAAKVSESLDSFREAVNGTVDENYWWGLCGVLLAGAELANRLGAELDIGAMRAFLIEAYHDNRKVRAAEGTEGGSLANTEQWLAAFLNDYSGRGHAMWTDKVFDKNRHNKIAVLHEPEKYHHLIYVQVACDQRLIIINKREMKNYLEKHEVQTKGVFDGLVKYFKATGSKRTIGAGTVLGQVQEPCFTIPVSSDQSILYEFMTRWGPPQA